MAISIGDAVLKITGDTKGLDQSLQKTQTKMQSASQKMQKALLPIGLAFTAIGAAGLMLVDSARKMNAQLGVTALNLGVTTKEMRNLALEATNVTFPLKEVIASFDFLARAGVKDTQVLKDTATAFDTLGDAIGMSASQVTEVMVPAMKTFRLSAKEIASKIDMMTYVVRNSTISLDDFNTMVGYTDQEMVDAGFTIEDMAAAMIYMSDNGVEPGRVMLREWMKAVTKSKKESISMTEALGITREELEKYTDKLAGATGMAQENADMMNKQLGIMDKLRAKWEELTLQYGTFLQPLEPILATMTALGPVMMIFSTVLLPGLTFATTKAWIVTQAHNVALVAKKVAYLALHPVLLAHIIITKAVTVAQWLWNAAMAANPIGLLIIAIGGLIAIGIALLKNWDKVTYASKIAWVSMKIAVLTAIEKILGALVKFTSWMPVLGEKVQAAHDAIANMVDAEKVERDLLRVNRALEINKELIGDTEVAVEDLTEAEIAYREELVEQQEVLLEQQEIYEGRIEQIEEIRKQLEYERSEAGKLRITTDDVTRALILQGRTNEEIQESWKALGEEVNDVNAYLEAWGLTAKGVDEILKDLIETSERPLGIPTIPGMAPAAGVWGPGEGAPPGMTLPQYEAAARSVAAQTGVGMVEAFRQVRIASAQEGGIAMRPMLATVAEKQPEAIIPLDKLERMGLGGRLVNIFVELDGRVIAKVIGQPLVEEIRLRTGVRI